MALSSFSLVVLQSVMKGLQKNLMERSKHVLGAALLKVPEQYGERAKIAELVDTLKKMKLHPVPEYLQELLLESGSQYFWAIGHGIDPSFPAPPFMRRGAVEQTQLGFDLAINLKAQIYSPLTLISPIHWDSFMGDSPRTVSTYVDDLLTLNVPEVEWNHFWTRQRLMQNLMLKDHFNALRLYVGDDYEGHFSAEAVMTPLRQKFPHLRVEDFVSWEQSHGDLMKALYLEKTVMLSLFVAMTLLVAIAVTSGLLLFFNKIRVDLMVFWLQGLSPNKIYILMFYLLALMALSSTLTGTGVGLLALKLWDYFDPSIMPRVFVEQRIPITIEGQSIALSILIPSGIMLLMGAFAMRNLNLKQKNLVAKLRSRL